MKVSAVVTALAFAAPAAAFAPNAFGARQATSLSAQETSRSDFLKQSLSAAAAFSLLTPQSASAAKYGSFGAGSPEVINPSDAVVDSDILASEPVQKALKGIKGYADSVKSMKATLAADGQADIGPTIRRDFEFSKLRSDLNAANEAFDEDTQRGTDRIVRIILQDITELETSNRQKPGVPRSERRLATMMAKLDKLEKAFGDYLAFV